MPSLAILSRLGVRPAIKPRLYAPMFHIPMSSPMMTRMFGLLPAAPELGVGESAACAAVAMIAINRVAAHCFSMFGLGFMVLFCVLGLRWGGLCAPIAVGFIFLFLLSRLGCGWIVGLVCDSGNLSVVWL